MSFEGSSSVLQQMQEQTWKRTLQHITGRLQGTTACTFLDAHQACLTCPHVFLFLISCEESLVAQCGLMAKLSVPRKRESQGFFMQHSCWHTRMYCLWGQDMLYQQVGI